MKWFTIDGREWNVKVFEPEQQFTILYTENTGRTLGEGAPMVLDPIGTFYNYTLTFGRARGEINEFDELYMYLSQPRSEPFVFVLPHNQTTMQFEAYVSNGKRKIKKIIEDSGGDIKEVVYDTFTANIIATKAQVQPQ